MDPNYHHEDGTPIGIGRYLLGDFISANREQLGLHLIFSEDRAPEFYLTQGLGRKPHDAPKPMMGLDYPRELVEHHLDIESMWARVLNIGAAADAGHFGVMSGMRFIQTRRYITNELDCYRQYPGLDAF